MMIGTNLSLQAAAIRRQKAASSAAAYRYWRVQNIVCGGAYLEVSELQLCVGGVRQVGSISVSSAGGYNDVQRINDNDLNTREFWAIVLITPDFWIGFDFGAPVAIDGIRQGGFDSSNRIMMSCDVYGSSDNLTWSRVGAAGPMDYPGNNTLSVAYPIL